MDLLKARNVVLVLNEFLLRVPIDLSTDLAFGYFNNTLKLNQLQVAFDF